MLQRARRRRSRILFSAVLAVSTVGGLSCPRASADPLVNVTMLGWDLTTQGPAPSSANAFLPSVQVNAGDTVVYSVLTFLSPTGTTNQNTNPSFPNGHTITSKVSGLDGIQSLSFDSYELASDQIQVDFKASIPAATSTGVIVSPAEGLSLQMSAGTNWKGGTGANGGALAHAAIAGNRIGSGNDLVLIRPALPPGTFRGIASTQTQAVLGTGLFVVNSLGTGTPTTLKMRYAPSYNGGSGGGLGFNGKSDVLNLVDAIESGADPFTAYAALSLTPATPVVVPSWSTDSPGSWMQSNRWSPAVPNTSGAIAVLGPVITAPRQITVDAPVTVGSLNLNSSQSYTLAGAGPVYLDNAGAKGLITVSAGQHAISAPIVLTKDAVFTISAPDSALAVSGAISGSGGLTVMGSGILLLRGPNSYAGGTTLGGGILNINSDANLGQSSTGLDFFGGTLQVSATISISRNVTVDGTVGSIDTNGFSVTLTGNVAQLGLLKKVGPGTLLLTGTHSSLTNSTPVDGSNAIRVKGGLLIFNSSASFSGLASLEADAGGAAGLATGSLNTSFLAQLSRSGTPSVGGLALSNIDAGASVNFNSDPLFSMSLGAIGTINYTGTITPNASLGYRLGGGGTLVLANSNALTGSRSVTFTNGGTVALASANNFTGNITVSGTTLNIKADNALGTTTNTIAWDTGGSLQFASNFNLDSARPLTLNTGGGTIDTESNTTTIAHAITGSGSLTKAGSGTLVLTGSNTYSGGTIVNAGTFINNGTISGTFSANAGGTIKGSGTYTGPITINSGGTISPGNSPGTITSSSGTLNSAGAYLFDIRDANGPSGAGLDYWHILNQLTIASTSGNPFLIKPDTLDPSNNPGLADNFDPTHSYQWILIQADSGITGFSPNDFAIDPSAFLNPTSGGSFSISESGNDMLLNFSPDGSPVPEPSTSILVLAAGLLYITRRRRPALLS